MKVNKRLLLIAYEMPPRWGPHALRIAYFCKELGGLGWKIDAVGCAPWKDLEDYSLLDKIPMDVNVVRIPQRISGGALSSVIWTLRATWASIKIIRVRKPDVILSSAPQYISIMAGYLTALLSGIPWVADFGDPFSSHVGYKRAKIKQQIVLLIEKLWLKKAKCYVLVTQAAKDYFDSNFPNKIARTEVVPLGYDPEDKQYLLTNSEKVHFRIAFAGSLHLGMSDGPTEFFKGIAIALESHPAIRNKIKIDIITRNPAQKILMDTVSIEVQDVFCFHSHIPDMGKVFEILSNSSCLLLWGFHGGLQIPSKLFVYFGLKKPILALICNPNDPMREIIERNNRGIVVENSADLIAKAVLDLFNKYIQGTLEDSFSKNELNEFVWKELVKKLSKILDKSMVE